MYSNCRKDIGEAKIVVTVFSDLQRAFETIDRKISISRFKSGGIGGVTLILIEEYLKDDILISIWRNLKN